ncbi:hypothetical protein ACHAXT_000061 [Thalassiosira profunda]
MGRDLEALRNRLSALEAGGGAAVAEGDGDGEDVASDRAATESANMGAPNNTVAARRGIQWQDSLNVLVEGDVLGGDGGDATEVPMKKIKIRTSPTNSPDRLAAAFPDGENQLQQIEGDDDSSSSSSSSEEAVAFSGWARCFFQARTTERHADHQRATSTTSQDTYLNDPRRLRKYIFRFEFVNRAVHQPPARYVQFVRPSPLGMGPCFFQARTTAATQITSGATSTTSQDTYLYLTIHSTSNELRISDTDERFRPPLIDPPIPLRYFYAAKVPGSHSGAALFLRNDPRRLRKYIFRFEFVNRAVHQPPARYVQFVRSGKAAKKSMHGINKMKNAFTKMGDERRENARENKKRAQDAFAAHLGTLDELLRESDEAAERFVECVNARNEAEEELARNQRELAGSGVAGRAGAAEDAPAPPYWGSGFNRPGAKDEEDDDDVDSDSEDYSDEEDELYYDDDNDDETLFDRVKVSTEESLETLFQHIVK